MTDIGFAILICATAATLFGSVLALSRQTEVCAKRVSAQEGRN